MPGLLWWGDGGPEGFSEVAGGGGPGGGWEGGMGEDGVEGIGRSRSFDGGGKIVVEVDGLCGALGDPEAPLGAVHDVGGVGSASRGWLVFQN